MTPARTALFLALLAAMPLAHAQHAGHKPRSADRHAEKATTLAPVEVRAHATRGYRGTEAGVASVGVSSLQDTPATVTVITRDLIDDRQPRSLSELVHTDAAVGDNYAPVGYYQDVAIRGFTLDFATGYRLNDLSIAGAQRVPLEDKQQVEILKGLAGINAGVVAPGGLINYVSKRPTDVRTVTVGTDSHGSAYAAVDLGAWLTPDFGMRINAAKENIHSAVDHANGHRRLFSLAADWHVSDAATLRFDIDDSHDNQRSVSGYQLLGGTTLPQHPSATRMLGFEPWQKPVRIDAVNASSRLDVRLGDGWKAHVAVGHSRSSIDDNVAYAYGCFYAAACASGTPGNFFAPNGDYDVYDYRSPGDIRRNDEARATLDGHLDTGSLEHALSVGVDVFRRRVDQRPYVYDYVGTANIDQVDPPYFAPSPNQPGPSARRLTSWQRSLLTQDRITLATHWQLLAGARLTRLDERAYDDAGVLQRKTRLSRTLPQAALLWLPNDHMTGYLSYSKGLSLGGEAPWWASNGGELLGPRVSRQLEAGMKYVWHDALNLDAAVFRITRPNQFAMPDASAAGFTFVQRGEQVNTGIELSAAGRLTRNLRLTASTVWLHARMQHSGVAGYDGRQTLNVPRLRASLYADYRLPFARDLSLLGGWRYSGRKAATTNGNVQVPAYSVFDAGVKYHARIAGHAVTWHLSIDNLFNRFYWRDSGSAYGDTFLFPGEPRLARLSMTVAL